MANSEPNLNGQVVSRLREMILCNDLSGRKGVAEIPVAERLGVSRTPMREALMVQTREYLLDTLESCLAVGAGIVGIEGYAIDDDIRRAEMNGRFHRSLSGHAETAPCGVRLC